MTSESSAAQSSPAQSSGAQSSAAKPSAAPVQRRGPVVVSSLTGKPISWPASESPAPQSSRARRPVIPDRVRADEPEPGTDESNDARLAQDVPPHWGRGS